MKIWMPAAAILALVACSGGPYADLEVKFASGSDSSRGDLIAADTLVLVGKNHRGAFNYRGIINIRLTADTIDIEPRAPFALGMKKLSIPQSAISLYSRTCFDPGKWDANLLFAEPPVEISVPNSNEIMDWCWARRIPIASGKARRDWMYSNAQLPLPSTLAGQCSSREAFDHAARQACLGY